MKICFFTIVILITSIVSEAQNEDPVKVLSYPMNKKESLDKYLEKGEWKPMKGPFTDEADGDYFLYRKKALGGGWAYIALWPEKFMHYQVFFYEKRKYSKVLNFHDFMHVPEGKSEYNTSLANNYGIKSINFDDPTETRNTNIFYGKKEKEAELNNVNISEDQIKKDEQKQEAKDVEEHINLLIEDERQKEIKEKEVSPE